VASNSSIEWTTHTFNPWRGCTKVSEGCKHCYAETLSGRNPKSLGIWGPRGTRVIAAESYWREPLKWNRQAANGVCVDCGTPCIQRADAFDCECGQIGAIGKTTRPRVFCASLADVFEGPDTMPAESVAIVESARRRLFGLIALTPNLDWLLLTKRPENAAAYLSDAKRSGHVRMSAIGANIDNPEPTPRTDWPLPNLWIGTSVENQAAADARIPELLKVPAVVRFLSCEPLLGPVDLRDFLKAEWMPDRIVRPGSVPVEYVDVRGVDWVIVGGESGHGARPMHPDWARSIRDQCNAAGVPFLFKQWGEWVSTYDFHCAHPELPKGLNGRESADVGYAFAMWKVGKKLAGRLLDGHEWNEMPTVAVAT
jgi:protein gp37